MTDNLVWAKVLELMPIHDCGAKLRPGGDETIGHVVVCLRCSYFAAVDENWVAALVDQARAAIEAPAT